MNKDYEEADEIALTVREGMTAHHYDKDTGLWKPFNGAVRVAPGDAELLRIS